MIFTTYPYHVVLVPKTKTKRQRTWDKLPVWIKKTPDSSRGHKISTRNGSVGNWFRFNLQIFGILDRSLQGVFVSKNQTKVTYPLQPPAREPASPPIYFRSPSELPTPQDCQPYPLVPNLAASTFTFGALSWWYRELKFKF
jgi:hypothetical protein